MGAIPDEPSWWLERPVELLVELSVEHWLAAGVMRCCREIEELGMLQLGAQPAGEVSGQRVIGAPGRVFEKVGGGFILFCPSHLGMTATTTNDKPPPPPP